MSANTAHANGGVLIFNGEIILLYCDGVEFSIEGISAKELSGTKKGRIYLTTHRMIFLNKIEKDSLQSFSFPFFSLSNVELEQPVFGANYIKGVVNAQNGGNFSGRATFKLKFFSGGAIEFGQAMLRAAQMARQYMPPQPPAYTPYAGPYYPAPPPAYMAPEGGVNGFVPPTHVFPNAPPANSVFTTDMPPPYPGIYPPPQYFPQQQSTNPQAAQNGYPMAAPQNGYPTQPMAAPQNGYPTQPMAAPQNGYPTQPMAASQNGYPMQPMANGYAYGPPPPGFAPTSGPYNIPPGAYPPPYSTGPAQHSGYASQAPASETKSGIPVHTFYNDPQGQGGPFALVNGNYPNSQGPPPPYPEDAKKHQ